MARSLVSFIVSQRDQSDRVPLPGLIGILDERLEGGWGLPLPYRIYAEDDTLPPRFGFPVERGSLWRDVAEKLDAWIDALLADRLGSSVSTSPDELREGYLSTIAPISENAMLSNFLADYHAIFWLAHSTDVAKIFSTFPSRIARHGGTLGRSPARLMSRIFREWADAIHDTLDQTAERLTNVLGAEGRRNVRFFDHLVNNGLIFTTLETDPDFRGARYWLEGSSAIRFREVLETLDDAISEGRELAGNDAGFSFSLENLGYGPSELDRFALLDPAIRNFLLRHPKTKTSPRPELQSAIDATCGRILEFEILDRIRRSTVWTSDSSAGTITNLESGAILSSSTRSLNFDSPGVVDPIVHRFGLVYDLSAFSEKLGEIARAGVRKELLSYRQMFLFQKRMDRITSRNRLKFEKFLGDGAFYTTRHPLHLVTAAVEIQEFYSRMRERGFLFDSGLRIALNYGYYRLLPLNDEPEATEPLIEFYGPGIVELSRLTTGKSTRDLEELAQYLIARGYEAEEVRRFFAPLGNESSDREVQSDREFFATVDRNRNLVNEGIVAAWSLIEELDETLEEEEIEWGEIKTSHGVYAGFLSPSNESILIGLRSLGRVNLKGLSQQEIVEIVSLDPDSHRIEKLPDSSLSVALRRLALDSSSGAEPVEKERELTICSFRENGDHVFVMGTLDLMIDALDSPVRISGSQLRDLLGVSNTLEPDLLTEKSAPLTDLYRRLAATEDAPPLQMETLRDHSDLRIVTIDSVEIL